YRFAFILTGCGRLSPVDTGILDSAIRNPKNRLFVVGVRAPSVSAVSLPRVMVDIGLLESRLSESAMIRTEGARAAQASVERIELKSNDGTILRGSWWRRESPRGVVVIAHGYGEHGGGYWRVAEALGSRLELDVIATDFRGHGHSGGRRGVVRS